MNPCTCVAYKSGMGLTLCAEHLEESLVGQKWGDAKDIAFYKHTREDPWGDFLGVDGKNVELRKIKGPTDPLHDVQCTCCGERTKARQTVLALLTMEAQPRRAVIHLTCLETYLDQLPDETVLATKRRAQATAGLIALEKDLAARAQ